MKLKPNNHNDVANDRESLNRHAIHSGLITQVKPDQSFNAFECFVRSGNFGLN